MRHSGQNYTIEYHRNSHNVVYETARSDLMDLVDRGLLRKRKRGKTWIFAPRPTWTRNYDGSIEIVAR